MTIQNVDTLYQQALLADAAYLQWNDLTTEKKKKDGLRDKRKFSQTQADDFLGRYTVLAHQENTPSGFAATLFKDKISGKTILAIRGTEAGTAADLLTDLDLALITGTATLQYNDLKTFLLNNASSITGPLSVTGHSLGGHLAMKLSLNIANEPGIQNIDIEHTYTYNAPGIGKPIGGGLLSNALETFLNAGGTQANNKITNLYGTGGLEVVTGLGTTYGDTIPLFIETNGWVSSHFIASISDTLSVYQVLDKLETLDLSDKTEHDKIHQILQASHFKPEKALGSILGAVAQIVGLDQSFANKDKADDLYKELEKILVTQAGTFELTALYDDSIGSSPVSNSLNAKIQPALNDQGAAGLAYRYALYQLNPFILQGSDNQSTEALYTSFNSNGQLDLFDAGTGTGQISEQWLHDRSDFLERVLWFNGNDIDPNDPGVEASSGNHVFQNESKYFEDMGTGYIIQQGGIFANTQHFIFGSDGTDELTGQGLEDHLYGGAGSDVISGKAGDDYLEGGTGNDRLDGGAGNDTYWFKSGDGLDTVIDSDGDGEIIYDDISLDGGKQLAKGGSIYQSTDKKFTYILLGDPDSGDGASLYIKTPEDMLTVRQYHSGDLGLNLIANTDAEAVIDNTILGDRQWLDTDPSAPGIQVGTDPLGNPLIDPAVVVVRDDLLSGSTGNDTIISGDGEDRLYANAGDDYIQAGSGRDIVTGDEGNDRIEGGADTDILNGGEGDDRLFADQQSDLADALNSDNTASGTTRDWLSGANGDDILVGSSGQDALSGGAGVDQIYAGAGDDYIFGDTDYTSQAFDWTATLRDGVIDFAPVTGVKNPQGSAGDYIYAGGGDDVVWSDRGDDFVFGQGGNDTLMGGAGQDFLEGGSGDDTLIGGEGRDTYYYNLGDGEDTIIDSGSNNIYFGLGINVQSLLLGLGSLKITINGDDSNAINIEGFDANDPYSNVAIDKFIFSDGKSINYQQLLALGINFDGSAQDDTLIGTNAIDNIHGYDGNDILIAKGGNDRLEGGLGDDTLYGDAGNDSLDGGSGIDTMAGGAGNDTYQVDNAADFIIEGADQGYDRVQSQVPYTLSNHVKELTLIGNDTISVTGNALKGDDSTYIIKSYQQDSKLDSVDITTEVKLKVAA